MLGCATEGCGWNDLGFPEPQEAVGPPANPPLLGGKSHARLSSVAETRVFDEAAETTALTNFKGTDVERRHLNEI